MRGAIANNNVAIAVSIGETFAFELPINMYLAPDHARDLVVNTVKSAFEGNRLNSITSLTPEIYQGLLGAPAAEGVDVIERNPLIAELPDNYPPSTN